MSFEATFDRLSLQEEHLQMNMHLESETVSGATTGRVGTQTPTNTANKRTRAPRNKTSTEAQACGRLRPKRIHRHAKASDWKDVYNLDKLEKRRKEQQAKKLRSRPTQIHMPTQTPQASYLWPMNQEDMVSSYPFDELSPRFPGLSAAHHSEHTLTYIHPSMPLLQYEQVYYPEYSDSSTPTSVYDSRPSPATNFGLGTPVAIAYDPELFINNNSTVHIAADVGDSQVAHLAQQERVPIHRYGADSMPPYPSNTNPFRMDGIKGTEEFLLDEFGFEMAETGAVWVGDEVRMALNSDLNGSKDVEYLQLSQDMDLATF